MNVLKNFEAVFIGALVMTNMAAYATADVAAVQAPLKAHSVAVADAGMQVVVVKAKRLTAAEKASLS